MSLSNYTTLVNSGSPPFIAIPVFPSRVFRHGYFFINTEKGIKRPEDLKGKRGGVPEYSMTAAVYMRGLLQHEYGVKPSDIEWVQGRADRLGHKLPADVKLTQAPPGTELGDLLESGEPQVEEEVSVSLAEETLRRTIEELPEPERNVIRLRYGINGDEPQPLRETGRRLGLSAERVRQLESRALKLLATRRELEALREAA
jgi:RNA polymerase sigma factor (sigma-70 family)